MGGVSPANAALKAGQVDGFMGAEPAGGQKVIDQRDIARFVARRGQGLHHIALRVADIEEAMREARAAGLTVIDETPRPGARGSKIAFLHPKSTGGILIHFVERPDRGC